MASPRFNAGQRVSILRVRLPFPPDEIVKALPAERGPTGYRIKNRNEAFERVVDEDSLEIFTLEIFTYA